VLIFASRKPRPTRRFEPHEREADRVQVAAKARRTELLLILRLLAISE
jgi:hypothetical protein